MSSLKAVIPSPMLNFLTLLTALLIADAIILILPLSLHLILSAPQTTLKQANFTAKNSPKSPHKPLTTNPLLPKNTA